MGQQITNKAHRSKAWNIVNKPPLGGIMNNREINQEEGSHLFRVLDYLKDEFDGYPYEFDKDMKYFERLYSDFPSLDIEEELKQYHAWTLDQPSYKQISYRSRFRQSG